MNILVTMQTTDAQREKLLAAFPDESVLFSEKPTDTEVESACAIVGNVLGANMTMKRGTGFIRRMLLVVLALLLAKMVWDVVS